MKDVTIREPRTTLHPMWASKRRENQARYIMSAWPELGALTRLRIWLYLLAVPIRNQFKLYFCLQDAVLAEQPAGWLRLARLMAYSALLFRLELSP